MDLYALAFIQATDAARTSARSALPGAPVIPDRAPRTPRLGRTRRVTAGLLERAARAVEPRATPECTPAH